MKYEELSKHQLLKIIEEMRTRISELERNSLTPTHSGDEFHKTLIEGLKDVVFQVSPDGTLKYISPAVKSFGGYDAEKEVGQHIKKYFEKNIELSEAIKRLKQISVDKTTKSFEFMFKALDRKPFLAEITSKPLIENERVIALQCVLRDISDRRKYEEEKRVLEEKMVQTEKMEALGRLAGGIAHDLNNILSALVSYPDLLLMKLPDDSPFRQPLLTIQKSGQRAAGIVEDLLTLARKGVKKNRLVNLNQLVSEYLESSEHEKLKLLHPSIRFETSFETDLPPIMGSHIHLIRAIMSLVYNAANSIPSSGNGLITISTLNLYPGSAAEEFALPGYVVLCISDNGVGFSSADLKRIFEPFYTKTMMGRSESGIGMAVVWGTVHDHSGFINVNSRVGEGTTFELYFPISDETESGGTDRIPVEEYEGNGERIVVVDDVKEQREIMGMILTRLHYDVQIFSTGEAAVRYISNCKDPIDLVVLDMILGAGMDGLDTYREIIKVSPGVKALIVSGFSETERVKEAQYLGAGAYLKKPFTMEQLGIAVKKELTVKKG